MKSESSTTNPGAVPPPLPDRCQCPSMLGLACWQLFPWLLDNWINGEDQQLEYSSDPPWCGNAKWLQQEWEAYRPQHPVHFGDADWDRSSGVHQARAYILWRRAATYVATYPEDAYHLPRKQPGDGMAFASWQLYPWLLHDWARERDKVDYVYEAAPPWHNSPFAAEWEVYSNAHPLPPMPIPHVLYGVPKLTTHQRERKERKRKQRAFLLWRRAHKYTNDLPLRVARDAREHLAASGSGTCDCQTCAPSESFEYLKATSAEAQPRAAPSLQSYVFGHTRVYKHRRI
jgi:hypothetical protein